MMKLPCMEEVTRESLRCVLTEREIVLYAKRSAQASKELGDLEKQKKQVNDDIKAQMSAREAEVQVCGSRVRDGYEFRQIECHWILDPAPFGQKLPDSRTLIRDDTGDVVRTVRLTAEELKILAQGTLDLKAAEDKAADKKDEKKNAN